MIMNLYDYKFIMISVLLILIYYVDYCLSFFFLVKFCDVKIGL